MPRRNPKIKGSWRVTIKLAFPNPSKDVRVVIFYIVIVLKD